MAQNSIAPGFVKLFYAVASRPHVQVLPVDVFGTPTVGIEPEFNLKNGSSDLMSACVDAWIALLQPAYHSTANFSFAEFWYKPTPESDPTWIYTYEIGEVGTAVTAATANGQAVISLRTSVGGLLKVYMMESSFVANLRDPYPFSGGFVAFHNYLIGGTSWITGRDGGFPVVGIAATTKINDALRKKYLLNS